ncbi:MAG: ATPase, T2SS/T4P/T4SS family [Planctomycetia bacterium]
MSETPPSPSTEVEVAALAVDNGVDTLSARVRRALEGVDRPAFPASSPAGEPGRPVLFTPSARGVGRVLEAAALLDTDRLLVVGAGSGYSLAVASRLCREVHVVEGRLDVAEATSRRLSRSGVRNVTVHAGDLHVGLPGLAPFDAIIVATPLAGPPPVLVEQLAVGTGRLVYVREGWSASMPIEVVRRLAPDRCEAVQAGSVSQMHELRTLLAPHGRAARELAMALRRVLGAVREPDAELHRLLQMGESDLYRELGQQLGLPTAELHQLLDRLDMHLVDALPLRWLQANNLVPISRTGDTVQVASSNPSAELSELERALPGTRIELCLVAPETMRRLWAQLKMRRALVGQGPTVEDLPRERDIEAELADLKPDARLNTLYDTMLADAVAQRASDVHLERYENHVRVRFRIDGDLLDVPRYGLGPRDLLGLVNVIKVRADLDIAERRLPQGGRSGVRIGTTRYDLRVQTQPALHGEHVVIRILPQGTKLLTIEDLGFPEEVASRYRRLLDNPSGLLLVVGPTGSGKSTTLYAGLQILSRDPTRKVITVEDPVEYSIVGIQQVQARPEIGFGFHNAMRAFVREDPDVILVGEIRDGETALEALRASQTGHLVLSTLHCNDAVDAVQRLVDLGQHPNSIASELSAVLAQRLVKRNCKACLAEDTPPAALVREVFPKGLPKGLVFRRGKGCEACDGRGTRGRIAAVEFLPAGPDLRAAIAKRVTVDALRELALEHGLLTLRRDALRLVAQGTIALGELPLIMPAERLGEGA